MEIPDNNIFTNISLSYDGQSIPVYPIIEFRNHLAGLQLNMEIYNEGGADNQQCLLVPLLIEKNKKIEITIQINKKYKDLFKLHSEKTREIYDLFVVSENIPLA